MSREQLEEQGIDTEVDTDIDNEFDNDVDTDDDFVGLTDEEIAAINSEADDTDEDDADTNDHADDDHNTDDAETDGADGADTDNQDNDWQREAQTVAERRAAIDTELDAKLAELAELGQQYDDGDIYDGAYNSQKARIEREIRRIEAREAEIVSKEGEIAARETQTREQQQAEFASAVTDFMAKPENNVFVEGSAEFAALDQQLGVIASNMPPGTPFDVLLDKARTVVAAYMDLPKAGQPQEQEHVSNKQTMPSISGMPPVVPNSTDGNKYAHLDKLSGPDLERALADMSEEQQNAYLTQG